jgi:Zn-dependent peptidase ImmA (M78 family)/transcriptional regulator with XRE-family HTH domain
MNRVAVRPELLRWARDRAGRSVESLQKKFPKLPQWESGESAPTLKQLEKYARTTYAPVGYLFLDEPPDEQIPIPDRRTFWTDRVPEPSPNLLDAIFLCQRRQAWYRERMRTAGQDPIGFIGSARIDSMVEQTAAVIRSTLGFDLDARRECPTWTDALRSFIGQADDAGILVMVSGVVGNNNRRILDPEEFRGFVLADDLAPLIFINGSDTKAGQMFTLAHELAHLWLGDTALTDSSPASIPNHEIESWCNRTAAELLVPMAALRGELGRGDPLEEASRLARRFKVSTLVILRRMFDAGRLSREEYNDAYRKELERLQERTGSSGGDFYLTQAARLSRRFARAVIVSALEGQTLYRDAFHMLGIAKDSTFRDLGASLGYPI